MIRNINDLNRYDENLNTSKNTGTASNTSIQSNNHSSTYEEINSVTPSQKSNPLIEKKTIPSSYENSVRRQKRNKNVIIDSIDFKASQSKFMNLSQNGKIPTSPFITKKDINRHNNNRRLIDNKPINFNEAYKKFEGKDFINKNKSLTWDSGYDDHLTFKNKPVDNELNIDYEPTFINSNLLRYNPNFYTLTANDANDSTSINNENPEKEIDTQLKTKKENNTIILKSKIPKKIKLSIDEKEQIKKKFTMPKTLNSSNESKIPLLTGSMNKLNTANNTNLGKIKKINGKNIVIMDTPLKEISINKQKHPTSILSKNEKNILPENNIKKRSITFKNQQESNTRLSQRKNSKLNQQPTIQNKPLTNNKKIDTTNLIEIEKKADKTLSEIKKLTQDIKQEELYSSNIIQKLKRHK